MGNRLAQILAEIKTNFSLLIALKEFNADVISLIYKYVDDIFTSIHEDHIMSVKEKISEIVKMELTVTNEDGNQDVEFLDCIFHRNQDLSISNRWAKKSYNSLAILNYHSYHPMNMKRNVVLEMINHAYAVTSPEFFNDTRELLITILKNSSYPELFIIENVCINPSMPVDVVQSKFKDSRVRYVSCPYYRPLLKEIQGTIDQNNMKIKLAPRPLSNNKRVLFTKIKDFRDNSSVKNAIFKVCCNDCNFNHLTITRNFDVNTSVQRLIYDKRSTIGLHTITFPDHTINHEAVIIKRFYSKYDAEHSNYVLGHVKEMLKI